MPAKSHKTTVLKRGNKAIFIIYPVMPVII